MNYIIREKLIYMNEKLMYDNFKGSGIVKMERMMGII